MTDLMLNRHKIHGSLISNAKVNNDSNCNRQQKLRPQEVANTLDYFFFN